MVASPGASLSVLLVDSREVERAHLAECIDWLSASLTDIGTIENKLAGTFRPVGDHKNIWIVDGHQDRGQRFQSFGWNPRFPHGSQTQTAACSGHASTIGRS